MDISVYEVMKSGGVTSENTCCCDFDRNLAELCLKRDFSFFSS